MKKIILMCLVIVMCICSFTMMPHAFAATLGTLNYWYSDSTMIGRWKVVLMCSATALGTDMTPTTFNPYLSHAITQWKNAGIQINANIQSSEVDINFRYGNLAQVQSENANVLSTDTGYATIKAYSYEGEWLGPQSRTSGGYVYTKAVAHIVVKTRTANEYKKTITHELGHTLGWKGHSSSYSDVMYGEPSAITAITSEDKNHLVQVY